MSNNRHIKITNPIKSMNEVKKNDLVVAQSKHYLSHINYGIVNTIHRKSDECHIWAIDGYCGFYQVQCKIADDNIQKISFEELSAQFDRISESLENKILFDSVFSSQGEVPDVVSSIESAKNSRELHNFQWCANYFKNKYSQMIDQNLKFEPESFVKRTADAPAPETGIYLIRVRDKQQVFRHSISNLILTCEPRLEEIQVSHLLEVLYPTGQGILTVLKSQNNKDLLKVEYSVTEIPDKGIGFIEDLIEVKLNVNSEIIRQFDSVFI